MVRNVIRFINHSALFCVADGSCFPDHGDLDLARVGHFVLYLP